MKFERNNKAIPGILVLSVALEFLCCQLLSYLGQPVMELGMSVSGESEIHSQAVQ